MTVFTQNTQTGLRLNARPSFMITDILAANNTTISPAALSPSNGAAATSPPLPPVSSLSAPQTHVLPTADQQQQQQHQHHQYQLYQQHHQHFLLQQHQQQQQQQHFMYHQHQHPSQPHHLLPLGHGLLAPVPAAAAAAAAAMDMRVPAAGLSPNATIDTTDDFEGSSDNENDDEDGDSSVCSNGTKDGSGNGDSGGAGDAKSRTSHSASNPLSGMRPSSKKQRKARTAFSDHQLHSLEKSFTRQKYLSVQDRMELAAKLGISDTQVKTWFQNRRTKWKRQTSVGFELLVEAGNYAAYQRAAAFRSSYPPGALDASAVGVHAYLPPGYASAASGAPTAAELYYRHQHQQQLAAMQQQQQQQHGGQHQQHGQHPAYSMYAAAAAAAAAAMNGMPKGTAPATAPFPYATPAPNGAQLARPTAQLPPIGRMAMAMRRSCSPPGSQHSGGGGGGADTPATVAHALRESSLSPAVAVNAAAATEASDDDVERERDRDHNDDQDDDDESDIEV